MLQKIMVGPWGDKFLAECKALNRPVFLWTVNEEKWMKWSINKGVDGVITDDPKKYLEIADGHDEKKPLERLSLRELHGLAWVNLLVTVFGFLIRIKFGYSLKPEEMRIHNKEAAAAKS
jgi:phosphatidylglycerol phospholipase C